MANGLLDFFGKEYEDPRTQGLLQFGLGLMQQGGYQDRPVSLGQAFGAAGQQGMQAYQQAVAEKQRKEQLASQKEMQGLQKSKLEADLAANQASIESDRKIKLARQRLANFDNMVASGGGMLPQGMNVQAERMKLFAEAYPTEYAKIIAEQFTPKDPISLKAGDSLVDPSTFELLFRAEDKPSSTSPVIRDMATSSTTQATFRIDPDGTKTQISEERPIFAPKAEKTEKEDPYKLSKDITLFDASGQRSAPVYTRIVGNEEKVFVKDKDVPNGYRELKPSEIMMTNQFEANKPSDAYFTTAYGEISEERTGIANMERFVNALDGVEGGVSGWISRSKAQLDAFLNRDLDEKGKALLLLDAMQQGQLGALRIDVVGPGVMTEQDAQRLVQFMGGDLKKLTTDPDLVREAMSKVLEMKKKDFDKSAFTFNQRLRFLLEDPGGKSRGGYTKFDYYLRSNDNTKAILDEV